MRRLDWQPPYYSAGQLQRGKSSPQTIPEPRVGWEQPTLEALPDRRSDPRQTGGQDELQQKGEHGHDPPEDCSLYYAEGAQSSNRAGRLPTTEYRRMRPTY